MGIGSAVTGGLGVGMGIYNAIAGAKQARDAQEALDNYERQKLENVAEGLQVSTLGSDLQREEASRLASNQVNALREGGTRTMIGGLGRVQQGNQMVNRQIAADLDAQQKQIDQMRAEDDARIRSMQENREQNDINALSSQYNTGEQNRVNGISQGIQGASMIGNSFGKAPEGTVNSLAIGVDNQLQPAGTTDFNKIQAPLYPTSRFGTLGQGMFNTPNPYVKR